MKQIPSQKSFIKYPLIAFLSSMRFAIALLSILGIASIIGTVLPQNRSSEEYVVQFGRFWSKIFEFLGIYDVYSSSWFVLIMLFLVLSTSLCLWRNTPVFLKELSSYRLQATQKSLSLMKHSELLSGAIAPEIMQQYFKTHGFKVKQHITEHQVLIAGKKGAFNKLGYFFAHIALVIICIGGLIDSNMFLKLGIASGKIIPDHSAIYANDFKPESRLSINNLSFRSDISITEGKQADVSFINMGNNNYLLQELPFNIRLNQFNVDYYENGMPKNFASKITVTNKKTGQKTDATIRVNHPLTINGITIYQSNFGDGNSPLQFNTWNLKSPSKIATPLHANSQQEYPQLFEIDKNKYTVRFTNLNPINVEPEITPENDLNLKKNHIQDARSVKPDQKTTRNVGATIAYEIRDAAGQNHQFLNYMLPREINQVWSFFFGSKKPDESGYTWLMIPADDDGSMSTFMLLREAFASTKKIEQASINAAHYLPEHQKTSYILASKNILTLFNRGGYLAIDQFIQQNIPEIERENTAEIFYKILATGSSELLNIAQQSNHTPVLKNDENRVKFILASLRAMTDLHFYPAPVLMQLSGYTEVKSSGLQLSKSPGATWVYLGSILLILGCFCMFYIREKRIWILISQNQTRFAMSMNRHAKDLDKEFPLHIVNLKNLIKDFSHE